MTKCKFNRTGPRALISRWGADTTTLISRWGTDTTRANLLLLGPVEAEFQWDKDRIIGMHRWFDKLWHKHTSMLTEKLTELGFPILPGLIALPATLMSIPPEEHDLFSVLRKSNRNN